MDKIKIANKYYDTKRVSVRGRYRQFVWEKGKIKTHVKWKPNDLWKDDVEERLYIYRSSMVLAYASAKSGSVEYRVWVHTKKPDTTTAELQAKMNDLQRLFGISGAVWDESYPEENEPMHEDEKKPSGAELGEWFGYVKFNREGSVTEYYASGKVALTEDKNGARP